MTTSVENLTEEIDQHLNILYAFKDMNFKKLTIYLEKLKEIVAFKEQLNNLDLDLSEHLAITKNNNHIMTPPEFQDNMANIDDHAVMVYVHNAQLFKIYNSECMEDFINDDNCIYSYEHKYGTVEQVVRDAHPQKLNILFCAILTPIQINDVKKYIQDFMRQNPAFSNFNASSIYVSTYDNKTEFLLSEFMLKNISEKEKVLELFLKVLWRKKEDFLANSLELKHPPCMELDGARFYKLPSGKNPIGKRNPIHVLDQLMTTSVNHKSNSTVINNTFIIQNKCINNTNNNTTVINEKSTDSDKTLKSFYKMIYDSKPLWYKENGIVELDTIEAAYRDYFDDHVTTKAVISRQLNGKLFNPSSKATRTAKKVLVPYVELKKLF